MKPLHLLLGGALLFGLTQGRETVENTRHGAMLQSEVSAARREQRAHRMEARTNARMARVSLERLQAGCVIVGRPQQQGNPSMGIIEGTLLIEGMTVNDWNGMPLADGTLVCTRTNTGIVRGGRVADVAHVAPQDRAEYEALFGHLD